MPSRTSSGTATAPRPTRSTRSPRNDIRPVARNGAWPRPVPSPDRLRGPELDRLIGRPGRDLLPGPSLGVGRRGGRIERRECFDLLVENRGVEDDLFSLVESLAHLALTARRHTDLDRA